MENKNENEHGVIEKLRKIHQLAKHGVGGEKDSAKLMLQKLLKKHNLSLNDLESEEKVLRVYRYSGLHERKILLQCYFKFLNETSVTYYKVRKGQRCSKTKMKFELTRLQHAELQSQYEHYLSHFRAQLARNLKAFTKAFINKNNLFSEASESLPNNLDLSNIDFDLIELSQLIQQGMDVVTPLTKKLGH